MPSSISRRQLLASLATPAMTGPALLSRTSVFAESTSPAETLRVAQQSRFTMLLPANWIPDDIGSDGYSGTDGFFFATPITGTTIDEAFEDFLAGLGANTRPDTQPTTWNDQPALRFDFDWFETSGTTVIISHDQPFQLYGKSITHVAISADESHLDSILESVDFDPALVTPKLFIDSTVDRVELMAVYAATVDWEVTRRTAHQLTQFARTPSEAHSGIEFVVDVLRIQGDRHTYFSPDRRNEDEGRPTLTSHGLEISWDHVVVVYPDSPADLAGVKFGDRIVATDDEPVVPPITTISLQPRVIMRLILERGDSETPIEVELAQDRFPLEPKPRGRMVDPDIAYLHIPTAVSFPSFEEYAQVGHEIFRSLDEQTPGGWILDFRMNGGGGYPPMLATVVPLLPNGPVFGFQDASSTIEMVTMQDQVLVFGEDRHRDLLPEPYLMRSTPERIAVLIDGRTGSAAEITAMAFKGLDHVRFFGDDSAGLTTGNSTLNLFDGSVLALASSFEVDRDGVVYDAEIQPDEYIQSFAQTYLLDEDPVIQAAVSWVGADATATPSVGGE